MNAPAAFKSSLRDGIIIFQAFGRRMQGSFGWTKEEVIW
jgi:hypothetical protein